MIDFIACIDFKGQKEKNIHLNLNYHDNIFNVPLPAGTNTQQYFNAFDKVLDKLKFT